MLQLSTIDPVKSKLKALVIPVTKDESLFSDQKITTFIKKIKALKEFTGAENDIITYYDSRDVKAQRVFFMGMGKAGEIDGERLRTMGGQAVKKAMALDLAEVAILIPSSKNLNLNQEDTITAIGEGARLANHQFTRYKKSKHSPLKRIKLVFNTTSRARYRALIAKVNIICEGTLLARDWINTPANDKPPAVFARDITRVAQKAGLKVDVYDERWLKKKGFGSMLAVAQGSRNRPRLLVLRHQPKGAKKTVALIGKGVTFDTGGINLKPTGSIETMKCDMSGGAAVAATLITAARRKLNTQLVGVIPIVENMPSGNAIRPGDIVKAWSGKTVEIGNTDAEGRLILIDAMAWAIDTFSPKITIDMATLTGACVVALGENIAGIFSPDDQLADSLIRAGNDAHERCWRMPLPDDYKTQLKSDVADLSNTGATRWGGAITAALFLSEFVKDTRWAHVDIAGPAFLKKGNSYGEAGATGFGVRLLYRLLETI
jgi:leucyl aminopeptidase